jgi:hypothetical protein
MSSNARHILLLSGGKDSTALAVYMRDRYPNIDVEYAFSDTHKELPETYEFLVRLESYLDRPITRLSNDMRDRGFDHWLAVYRGYLPSPGMRWCTRRLKIDPFEKYVGHDNAYLYVAIRADERREGMVSTKPNIHPVFPFKRDGIVYNDVLRILTESGVGLPAYYSWRSRSGCYFCFFQRRIEWVGLLERHPNLFRQAAKYENEKEGYTWVARESLAELSRPDRIQQIRREHLERRARILACRRPQTLGEALGVFPHIG